MCLTLGLAGAGLAIRESGREARFLNELDSWTKAANEALRSVQENATPAVWSPEFGILEQRIPQICDLEQELQTLIQERQTLQQELDSERRSTAQARKDTHDERHRATLQREAGLRSSAHALERALTDIQKAAEQVRDASSQASQGAESQRSSLTSTASAMEEMNCTVIEVARNAEEASQAAADTRSCADDGAREMHRTEQDIESVADHTRQLSTHIAALGDHADAIRRVMSLISDIADQTNLLALNAAIEAARAGESGRGFAVVADEVRKLAEKTMDATSEVHDTVRAIQEGVTQASGEMGQATEQVTDAVEQARQSRTTLDRIVELSRASSRQVRSIAVAAEQQAKTSEEINRTIGEVSRIADHTTEVMQRSDNAVSALAEQVRELGLVNSVFDMVGGGGPRKVVQGLAQDPGILSLQRERQEAALRRAVRSNGSLELLYVTDARGRQTVSNIAQPDSATPEDAKAFGRDWSARPWYTEAMQSGTLSLSDIYTSETSGAPCITVSIPMRDREGGVVGVVAADIRVGGDKGRGTTAS
ncbi:methyl-accepting chemotaxis protein [Paucidesulfovibrio gracilis]|uniref:methyl-accepting chemotaxis protein n=1 Tax=Paucidesulfovibrio gracilis TaxID=47158 RepID=UPI00099AAFEA|nr:methyl-accepting chemotaxis protein [Paucidesulfovibrio gracilis]